MKPLRLYTAFHGNLDFSALPDADRALVIARCYWPILSLPEEFGIPIGFEMSARTLRTLQNEDPEWVKKFRGLAERGLIECIASGWAQVVAPLAPTEINRANFRLGSDFYREILGFCPETFFVNEQTYSDGLADLYQEAGARRVVMEWNNPATHQAALRALRCQPARLATQAGTGPMLLWNDSVVFQKIQRIAHGEIPASELESLLGRLASRRESEALCIYGGDVEIFDYRPSRSVPLHGGSGPTATLNGAPTVGPGKEMERLIETFRSLARDSRFEFRLPRDVVDEGEVLPEVRLGSTMDPIPCKKQPRYNPTRWAVSGRDGFGMNTRCHALLRTERAGRRLGANGKDGNHDIDLIDLWRSDFRTRATEEKVVEFEARAGIAAERSLALLANVTPELAEGEDLLLLNSDAQPWLGMPVEIPLRLPAGRYFDLTLRTCRGEIVAAHEFQLEVSGRHRDGSIREATLVVEPHIPARSVLSLAFDASEARSSEVVVDRIVESLHTEQVAVTFLSHRGAAVESLSFTGSGERPIIGTIPHGSFDAIDLTPDFYSGHVMAVSETGQKETDLRPTHLVVDGAATGAVRVTLRTQIESAHGSWQKRYRLYRHQPRFDLVHDLSFHEARLASLRLGTFTLLPDAWNRNTLRFGTVNGGVCAEWRNFGPNDAIAQSQAVSSAVSATSCLGATDGWVAFEDDTRGVCVQGDRAQAAVAAMIDYRPVEDSFFCRLAHTAAETDETRATFLRGRKRFSFAIEASRQIHRAGAAHMNPPIVEDLCDRARMRNEGLVYRTQIGVGVSSGL